MLEGYTVEQITAIAQIQTQQKALHVGVRLSERKIIEAGDAAIYALEHVTNPAAQQWLRVHGLI